MHVGAAVFILLFSNKIFQNSVSDCGVETN